MRLLMASAPAYSTRGSGARSSSTRRQRAVVRPRVRWDRLGRLALLLVLGTLVYLYLSAGESLLSTLRQAKQDNATVSALSREYRTLNREHLNSTSQAALEEQARRLGMIKPGGQPYIVSGLPAN